MSTKQASEKLGTSPRHVARLAKLIGVPMTYKVVGGRGFSWDTVHLEAAKKILAQRMQGRGRFTLAQER